MANAASKSDPREQALIAVNEQIERAVGECGIQATSKLGTFMQAVKMAQGIRALRQSLTDDFMREVVMPLQGSSLGFRTDKDKDGGYPIAVVRDVTIEAMLRGFSIIGNEFNIISDRFYASKDGLERRVLEFPGLRGLVLQPGVPALKDGGALVPFTATWSLGSERMTIACQVTKEGEQILDNRIPVRVNAGMGADAIIGKATRKMYFRILQRITGQSFGLMDGEVEDAQTLLTTAEPAPLPVPQDTPEGRRVKLPQGGRKAPPVGNLAAVEPQNDGNGSAPGYGEIELER